MHKNLYASNKQYCKYQRKKKIRKCGWKQIDKKGTLQLGKVLLMQQYIFVTVKLISQQLLKIQICTLLFLTLVSSLECALQDYLKYLKEHAKTHQC